MPPEMQILTDIQSAFLTAFGINLRIHYGDEISVDEAKDNLSQTVKFDYWLVPEENDKEDVLANSTEGEIQTFTAQLFIFGKKPDEVVQELYRVLALIYNTTNLISGIGDAPQLADSVLFHRFDPRQNRITTRASIAQGVWYCEQSLIISASKDV